ncbi:AMP-binding protein [Candidatus Frankia nodulisporulans]|uniref:AMP-binding protein n=1 Tax=Candidatus Frankia nodulisporulans TaxID=2060052 RepID=UPI001CDBC9FD|nr:AMP-binding protein [Candidatus Frankia nodulisporulans]
MSEKSAGSDKSAGSNQQWVTREVPAHLAQRYRADGLWGDVPMGVRIESALREHGDQILRVHSQERPWEGTFGELRERALAVAGGLRARGVAAGDAVAFQLPNWAEAAVAFYATSFLGAAVVPIVHFYGAKEVAYILRRTRVTAFVSAARFGRRDYLADLAEAVTDLPSLRVLAVVGAEGAELPAGAVRFTELEASVPLAEIARPDPDSPAVIAYTSGTTSQPKGVIHSHNTICAEADQLRAMNSGGGVDHLTGTPVGHFMGMLGALQMPVLGGSQVNMIDVWDPKRVLEIVLRYGLATGAGSTYFLASLLDHPDLTPEHMRYLAYVGLGGAAVPEAFADRATAAGTSVVRMYGSTEHPSITGTRHEDDRHDRLYTDGRPLAGVEIRLLDDEGRPVEVGVPGEIWSRGPDLCLGYTDASLNATVFDDEGWYRTEDVGVLDDRGCLTITDRKKDIIIRGGENISAAEVEELILKVVPEVLEVAVVAVPDERFGEKVCAVLRLAVNATAPTPEVLRERLIKGGLGRQKTPEYVQAVPDFPRTSTGKIIKAALRREAATRLA